MEKLIELYTHWANEKPAQVEKVEGAGSNRQYYRFTNTRGKTVIGVIGTSCEENHSFIYLTNHFNHQQLPVPHILAVSNDEMRYLQTDLGRTSLFDLLRNARNAGGRYTQREKQLLLRTIKMLPQLQVQGARGLDFEQCYPQAEFNVDSVLFDLNYFKYCFLKATGIDFNELKLEADFRLFAKDLTSESGEYFLYRDFQARNVMIDAQGNPAFIDYQGGRKGSFYYDVASFLWQASAKYSFKLRRELAYAYYESLKRYIEVPTTHHFVQRLSLFVLFRTLQVLGAYGFRGYFERKPHFLSSIPAAIQNLGELLKLDSYIFPYPYMMDMLKKMTELPQFAVEEHPQVNRTDGYKIAIDNIYHANPVDGPATFSKYDGKGELVVRVYSFSFHKGIPHDDSGNGGGYVFDCRSTHNPGRYEPYKKLTGLDEPVIRFLEDDGEILTFLENVYHLADHHVARYMERGFTNLMFSFGCTGGQHRSVYSAQHLAEHIHEKFGIKVIINHCEQHIQQVLAAKPTKKV